jgi:hypothetical protein
MATEWFSGHGRDARDEAVLVELRRQVSLAGLADVSAEDTRASVPPDQPLLLTVQVPGLREVRGAPELQVGVAPDEPTALCLVGLWETWGYVLDGALEIFGPTLDQSAGSLASAALGWLEQQLRRPVERAEWSDWRTGTKRVWRFADDGEVLCVDRGVWRARRRRAPDRVVRLR